MLANLIRRRREFNCPTGGASSQRSRSIGLPLITRDLTSASAAVKRFFLPSFHPSTVRPPSREKLKLFLGRDERIEMKLSTVLGPLYFVFCLCHVWYKCNFWHVMQLFINYFMFVYFCVSTFGCVTSAVIRKYLSHVSVCNPLQCSLSWYDV